MPEGAATILERHCVECHDAAVRKGGLDLSRREAALLGGRGGAAIVPGKAEASLLWRQVESGEMPRKRPPLSSEEKEILRRWIDAGAAWSGAAVDPDGRRGPSGEEILQRLTAREYIRTVREALGVDIEPEARRLLPADLRADGFTNTSYSLKVDLGHVEAYASLAQIIVARMDAARFAEEHAGCREPTGLCLHEVITRAGKWLLRGPLSDDEVAAFLGVASAVSEAGGDFEEAVECAVEAMLQSPRFIYRIERRRGERFAGRAGSFELASRLSYILWGGPPDRELLRAADSGELLDRDRVEAQVRRMLEDQRAVERSVQFIEEWLDLDRLGSLRPDPARFPSWDPGLAADMREETLAFFKHLAWEERRPLWDLFNARVTFVTPRLATHYGLPGAGPRPAERRVDKATAGLQALWAFEEGGGVTVRDVSGGPGPIDLAIEDARAIEWKEGALRVKDRACIATSVAPERLVRAIQESNAFTLEASITPADTAQRGPACIVTLSSGTGERNFTLGQEGDRFDIRFRTSSTDANGMPSLASGAGSVKTRRTHVVYTRKASGEATLYVDGAAQASLKTGGDLSGWNPEFRLALADETTRDRGWRGTFHRIALYSRALTPEEVRSHREGLERYDLSGMTSRGGLLTQGSVLTIGGDDASMVTRGLFILNDVLDSRVGSPPPCVDTTPVPSKPGLSQRDIAEGRIANASCGGCHSRFEPLAFGIEKLDGVGAYHDMDSHGNKLREDGSILLPGRDAPVSYGSSSELMDILAGSERVRRTLTRKVTQFALGRPLADEDGPVLARIHESALASGGTYAALITAIVMSDLVQMSTIGSY